jgi:glucose-6-phosphate 1-dehydrogenase
LRQRTSYLPGDFTLGTVYERLKQRLGEDDAAFYLATPPQFFGVIVTGSPTPASRRNMTAAFGGW